MAAVGGNASLWLDGVPLPRRGGPTPILIMHRCCECGTASLCLQNLMLSATRCWHRDGVWDGPRKWGVWQGGHAGVALRWSRARSRGGSDFAGMGGKRVNVSGSTIVGT